MAIDLKNTTEICDKIIDAADVVIPPIENTKTIKASVGDTLVWKLSMEEAKIYFGEKAPYIALPKPMTFGDAGIPPTPKKNVTESLCYFEYRVNLFISQLNDLKDNTEKALEFVFDELDLLLLKNSTFLVNETLKALDVEKYDTAISIGILTITAQFSKRLSARSSFVTEVKLQVYRLYNNEEAKAILEGLE